MKIKLIVIGLLFFNLNSCQEKSKPKPNIKDNVKKKSTMSNNNITSILIKQIEAGNDQVYGSYNDYNKEDFDESVKIIDTILNNNGFKNIDNEKFNKVVKNIFDRTIDNNSNSPYLKIDTYVDNICDKILKYSPYSVDSQFLYVVKGKNFITNFYPLPEIIDYLSLFPKMAEYEKEDIIIEDKIENVKVRASQWKDDLKSLKEKRKKNIQTLVARNMYLFNDSKAHGLWLRAHDENFMKNLVTTFGYTKDKVLLQWVIEKNRFKTESGITNGEDYGKILWHKTCDGKFVFHKETIEVMEREFIENRQNYIDDLFDYLMYIDNDENKSSLSYKEKAVIIAYVFNFALELEELKKQGDFLYKVGGYYEFSGASGKKLDKEFQSNNYYNLPNFKTRWEEAKKEGDGINPPE